MAALKQNWSYPAVANLSKWRSYTKQAPKNDFSGLVFLFKNLPVDDFIALAAKVAFTFNFG